jgi:cell division protein ZapA
VKRTITVEVAGQKLQIRTDADEDYLSSLAGYVNEKLGEVKSSTRTYSTHVLAVLAALRIADDLFTLRRQVREKSKRMLQLLENGKGT